MSREDIELNYKRFCITYPSNGCSFIGVIMERIAVRYQGLALMPMTCARARILVKAEKARIKLDRKLKIYFVQLLVEPSSIDTQKIVLGIDPGSTFDGMTVLSKDCHHVNIELLQRAKKGKNAILAFKNSQAANRRLRRSRLRHRPIKFSNRICKKIPPTIRANLDFRVWFVKNIAKLYPITKIRIEDVKFNHFKDKAGNNRKGYKGKSMGSSFSLVEVGKQMLYTWIQARGYTLELMDGFNTSEMRKEYLGGVDTKAIDKGEKSIEAHCLDSFIIAGKDFNLEEIQLNRKVVFIEKLVKQRRCLVRLRKLYKDKWQYFRYATGGVKQYFTNISRKENKCRIKPENEHSNHPTRWEYLSHGFAEKCKSNTARYGGTCLDGIRKFFVENEWRNRTCTIV